jgi:hypothetical protein
MTKLYPGDRVVFDQNDRKLKGVVADGLNLRARGEKLLIPVIRPRRTNRVKADQIDQHRVLRPRVRWIERSLLRKLPANQPDQN